MVEVTTYAFILMIAGLASLVWYIAFAFGKDTGRRKALTPGRPPSKPKHWSVVRTPIDASIIAFWVQHTTHAPYYGRDHSFEIGKANIDDLEAMTTMQAKAERRAEDFNAQDLKPQ